MALFTSLQLSDEGRAALADIRAHFETALLSLLVPTFILYLTMYALVKKRIRTFEYLSWLSVAAFLFSSWAVVVECSAIRSLQLFGGR